MTIAVGYVRVSTADQAGSGLGEAAQRATIKSECHRRGWELLAIHADSGLSATARERPGLEAAMRACTAAGGAALVVAKLDRLARSLVDYAGILGRSQADGWRLVALDAPDTGTPHGNAMRGVVAVFAELERELIAQRTREALAAARDRGVQLGRPLEVSPHVVAGIVDLHRGRRRLSASAIARQLTADGEPAPRGGAIWHPATVTRILAREGVRFRRGRPRRRSGAVRRRSASRPSPANPIPRALPLPKA